jgi:hypothetical protein
MPPPIRQRRGRPSKQLQTIREDTRAELPFSEHSQPAKPLNRVRRSQQEPLQLQEPTPVQNIRVPDLQAISDI